MSEVVTSTPAPRAWKQRTFKTWRGWLLFLLACGAVAAVTIGIDRRQTAALKILAVETYRSEGLDPGYLRFLIDEHHEECLDHAHVPAKNGPESFRRDVEYLRGMRMKLYYALLPGEQAEPWRRYLATSPGALFGLDDTERLQVMKGLEAKFATAAIRLHGASL